MERKRSSVFRRIFTVAFGYFRLGKVNVNDCPAGLWNWSRRKSPPWGLEIGEKLLWKYDLTRYFVFFPWSNKIFSNSYLLINFNRDNLDWLSRATNWAKLSATATLGVIHRGHEKESLSLMQSYLPKVTFGFSDYFIIYMREGRDIGLLITVIPKVL